MPTKVGDMSERGKRAVSDGMFRYWANVRATPGALEARNAAISAKAQLRWARLRAMEEMMKRLGLK